MKFFKLKTKDNVADYSILGISSHENDYRLIWNINDKLGLSFTHCDNPINSNGNDFTCFEDNEKGLLLVSNRCDNGFLFDKYKNLDFILKFEKNLDEAELSKWIHDLRKAPLVSAIFNIPINKRIKGVLNLCC